MQVVALQERRHRGRDPGEIHELPFADGDHARADGRVEEPSHQDRPGIGGHDVVKGIRAESGERVRDGSHGSTSRSRIALGRGAARVHHGPMGDQGEQDDGREGVGASDEQAAPPRPVSPAENGASAAPIPASSVRSVERPAGHPGGAVAALRRAVWTVMNVLAILVRLVTCAFAGILLLRIGLAFFATNPHNVIVVWIVRAADVLVWGFRDLFVPTDPRIGLVANDGLAAVFWVVVGVIIAWALSGFGRLVAGRRRT